MQIATFGAGCFWGVEETFRQVKGVISTEVGYSGGTQENPNYEAPQQPAHYNQPNYGYSQPPPPG